MQNPNVPFSIPFLLIYSRLLLGVIIPVVLLASIPNAPIIATLLLPLDWIKTKVLWDCT